jgi:putative DNA methylase
MVWDYAESSVLSRAAGDLVTSIGSMCRVIETLGRGPAGVTVAADAEAQGSVSKARPSTDPPYYDNIGYADLSDFFYVWLKRSLQDVYPDLFQTLLTPKSAELVATPYRFGGDKAKAERHFESGLTIAFERLREAADPAYPVTVYYAYKEADDGENGSTARTTSVGWETMLSGLLSAGFSIERTWPVRTERGARSISIGTNALASSVVLVCRPRSQNAGVTDRKGFLAALKAELPAALRDLQHESIAPVDLPQAAIGPGMAVFSRYTRIVETDGRPMTVRTALDLIGTMWREALSGQADEFDPDTRWAIGWFQQHGFQAGDAGEAISMARGNNVTLEGLRSSGIVDWSGGKVRLIPCDELDGEWDPARDRDIVIWEVTQQLIRCHQAGGDGAAATLVGMVGGLADTARDLAYRLHTICTDKGWSEEAQGYDALVKSWPEVTRLARGQAAPIQEGLSL